MNTSLLLIVLLLLSALAYFFGKRWAFRVGHKSEAGIRGMNSLPSHYGMLVALFCILPAFLLIAGWTALNQDLISAKAFATLPQSYQLLETSQQNLIINKILTVANSTFLMQNETDADITQAANHYLELRALSQWMLTFGTFLIAFVGAYVAWRKISPQYRARNTVEWIIIAIMILCASIAIITTLGILLSVIFESVRFFGKIPMTDFLFGTDWSPQTALRADQVAASGSFGAIPLFVGTLLISLIAMTVAVPVGLLSALYLSEYASPTFRAIAKPALEILAGIPTVVYGFFAALTVAPFIRNNGSLLGLDVSSESALAAGLVMGIMIIPFVSSLSDDVIHAVPQSLRDGSLGMGATKSETIKKVIFPAALPGIMGGILLAVSRAIGETMIVVMAAGLAANMTINPLEAVTTVTVQIVTLLVGDQEFDSAKTLAAFALGLMLFITTLILNVIALYIVRRYREQYD